MGCMSGRVCGWDEWVGGVSGWGVSRWGEWLG